MILAELYLRDYKQFHGEHRFVPPPEGIVAIIGPNGAGKTTLFEAIEWCLYNPREIVSEEIPTRGRASQPVVRVVLHDPREDVRYVVERQLKRSGAASAMVYREDQPETPIAQGSRQVTEYISRHLIGLDHRAFVSTFFTRQKELTFFGNLKETDRRREVGRLLGMETIRRAQQLIAEERTAARNQAQALQIQHQEQAADRDFAAEREAAEAMVAAREAEVVAAEANLAAVSQALIEARDRLTRLQELERQDKDLRLEAETIAGHERAAAARHDAAREALARLTKAEADRAALLVVAERVPALTERVTAFALERERHLRAEQLRQDLSRADRQLAEVVAHMESAVTKANASEIEGWTWRQEDAADPIAAATRRISVAAALDTQGAADRAAQLDCCLRLAHRRNEERAKLAWYEQKFQELERQHAEIIAAGDPAEVLASARQEREEALAAAQSAKSNAQHARQKRSEYQSIVTNLQGRRFEDRCPTCARPFTPHELELTVAALSDRIEALDQEIQRFEAAQRREERRAQECEQRERAAQQRQQELSRLMGRLQEGRRVIAEQQRQLEATEQECAEELRRAGLDQEPDAATVEAARSQAELYARVARTIPVLEQLRERAATSIAEREEAARALAELGPISYDAAAHQQALDELTKAREAAARIEQIDQELAQRPDHEAALAAALAELERCAAERARIESARAALGFDPRALEAAQAAERTAKDAERAALEARGAAIRRRDLAVTERERLIEEHNRINSLAERANACAREADLLDQMYREFTRFEQYAAARLAPELADRTSELLRAVTEGKYDQVEFNENYGIEVYDGADEKFPMEEFSGGERDVIALCARLALSRLIGARAHRPPGFLVLDEVFGALDRDRRTAVLETLGSLAGTADVFHQLFIISHVDDVRAAPIFSEIWRVTETADGVSRLENLTASGGMEDI